MSVKSVYQVNVSDIEGVNSFGIYSGVADSVTDAIKKSEKRAKQDGCKKPKVTAVNKLCNCDW